MNVDVEAYYTKPALLNLEVDDTDKDFNSVVNESSFRINLEPSEAALKLFEEYGFAKRGQATWSRHLRGGDSYMIERFFNEYSASFSPNTLFASKNKAQKSPVDGGVYTDGYYAQTRVRRSLNRSTQMFLNNVQGSFGGVRSNVLHEIEHSTDGVVHVRDVLVSDDFYNSAIRNTEADHLHENLRKEFSPAHFYFYVKNSTLWVKMVISPSLNKTEPNFYLYKDDEARDFVSTINGRINAPGQAAKSSRYITRQEAEYLIDGINGYLLTPASWDIEKSQRALDFLGRANSAVTAGYAPGQPAKAYVTRGRNVPPIVGMKALKPGESKDLTITRILKAEQENPDVNFVIHPSLLDIVNMNKATDYKGEKKLHSYQKKAVSLHLSTEIGYLNSSDPGLGKSIMQLTAMRERAKDIDNYRGLIVCEANVREQWKEYANTWFPEAEVFILGSSSQTPRFVKALAEEKPVIVLSSYALTTSVLDTKETRRIEAESLGSMSAEALIEFFADKGEQEITIGDLFADTYWHDICADEAVCIRNGASQQARAMWTLRWNSDVAVALTGTPVNKNPDDMGKLLEWVRKDRRLFQKRKLSENYDTETLEGATTLFEDLSPLVFRREWNEVRDEIENGENAQKAPTMVPPETLLLKPSAEERSLAHAAEKELKRVYLELVSALESVEQKSGSSDEIKEAKEQLRDAHGQWLGGTQLARMATSDPASLMNSDSVGASLLVGQGLVENALAQAPTKRKIFIEKAQEHVEKGQSILVFTDFAVVAESLVEALEENGISAGTFTGKNKKARERNRLDFQNGDLNVLVCTKAAERGLTLHRAAAVYHYDMPWTIERLIQRMGRAIRVGAENEEVEIYFLILEDTVEERVAKQVLSQGTTASMILDASRGVDVSKTGLGNTMSGLMGASKSMASRKGALEFGKALNLV